MIPKPSLLMIDDNRVKFVNETISKEQSEALRDYYYNTRNIPDKIINSITFDTVLMSDESCSQLLNGILD